MCGDYRSTVNASIKPTAYPLPTVAELLAILRGGQIFSKIDLTQAYQQLHFDKATSEMLTINTIKGLYAVKRLPFGVSASPSIFQRFMDTLLAGLPGLCAYLDDILIMGASNEEHLDRLEAVLQRLQQAGLKANKEKCIFGVREVQFLGYGVSSKGVEPTSEKVEEITSHQNQQTSRNYSLF
ncbi:uncharacterized protein K02A2.6-like [Rhipicephalus sanguineus]|uniref:uncharacterized protein K02A2.6-like n=1 Tax=Rhipicephalus sanguineus TaxID=34632 RepID=UPI001893FC71|nr:uncharacterized protein K02A2.6-like [Rhipicephalus sanguineus]